MAGLTHTTDGKALTIKVNLVGDEGKSESGKNFLVASTRGNIAIGDGIKFNLNVYRPNPDYVPPKE